MVYDERCSEFFLTKILKQEKKKGYERGCKREMFLIYLFFDVSHWKDWEAKERGWDLDKDGGCA